MEWNNQLARSLQWFGQVTNEQEKQEIANKLIERVQNHDVIGVGSGSTSFVAIQAIAKLIKEKNYSITAIPTSQEVLMTCSVLGVPTTTLQSAKPDWAFDGADEVDSNHNLIKGRGGAMFHEKLVMASSSENYILVDSSKYVSRLGEKHPVPMEVDPRAVHLVETRLSSFPIEEVNIRQAESKDGPVLTEAGNIILDVRFSTINDQDERNLKVIPGVIETGLFIGYNVEILSSK